MTVAYDIEKTLSPYFAKGLELWIESGALRFKAPKEILTPDLMALLKQEKEHIQHWLADKASDGKEGTQAPLLSFPLASTQAAIWMLYQFSPTNAAYNTAFAFVLSDDYQIELIKQALHGVFIRHDMLRTTFTETNEGTRQQVWKSLALPIDVTCGKDWSEETLQRKIAEAADKPFNLETESCLRVNLFKNTHKGDVMVATIHHIGADLWALLIIAKELSENYQSLSKGEALTVTPLIHTYHQHVEWQQDFLTNESGARAKTFWKEQLRGAPLNISIEPDFNRPPVLTMESGFYQMALSNVYQRRIRDYCKMASVTPFVLMQSVFQFMIARETHHQDFLVGTPTMGRNSRGMDQVVGDFANPVILRANVDFDKTVADLLLTVKQDLYDVMEYQDYPFPNIVRDCNPPRDPSRTPLFQLMFIWHQGDASLLESSVLVKQILPESGPRGTPYDVMLAISDLSDTFELNWTYQKSLYQEDTIKRLAEHYVAALESILSHDSNVLLSDIVAKHSAIDFEETTRQVKELFCLSLIDISLPKRNAFYIYHHGGSAENVFKQLYVEGDAFDSSLLRSAFDEVVFVHAFPYTKKGEIDVNKLEKHVSISTNQLKKALCQSGVQASDCYINYQQLLYTPTDFRRLRNPSVKTLNHTSQTDSTITEQPLAYAQGKAWEKNAFSPLNLAASLKQTAHLHPNKGIVFSEGDNLKEKYCYRQLFDDAKQVAGSLLSSDLKDSEIILLQMQLSPDFFATWWGVLLSGIKPLVIARPDVLDRENALAGKLYNVATRMEGLSVIADDDIVDKTVAFLEGSIAVIPAKGLLKPIGTIAPISDETIADTDYDRVAFLQLTSGSTGTPKAIQITHEGVLHHICSVAEHNQYDSHDITLNWLPFDHVVPLLTTHIKDVVLGINQIQLPTQAILSNPWMWLTAMSKFRVTHSWAPNFGFQRVVDTLDSLTEVPEIDLTCVKKLMNAGEQVLSNTVTSFTAMLEPFGLDPAAVQPAFGMAECCTCITYNNESNEQLSLNARGNVGKTPFVDLGDLIPGIHIRITDAENRLLREGESGRLQIKGPVVTPGYLANQAANQEAFVGDGWFNSGDLGFIKNGRLCLTGREKEMIVIHGANQYCYDIEQTLSTLSDIESGAIAAVGVSLDEEKNDDALAIFYVPVDPNAISNINRKIVSHLSERMGLTPSFTIPVNKNGFYKTTSGKIQRGKFKAKFKAGEYNTLTEANTAQRMQGAVSGRHVLSPHWHYSDAMDRALCPKHDNLFVWPSDIWKNQTGPQLVKTLLSQYIDTHRRHAVVLDMGCIESALFNQCWFDVVSKLACIKSALAESNIESSMTLVFRSRDRHDLLLIRPLIETLKLETGLETMGCVVACKDSTWVPNQCYGVQDIVWLADDDQCQGLSFENTLLKPYQIVNPTSPIKEKGVYVITGGLGGLGLSLARWLMTHYSTHLILVGREDLKPKSLSNMRLKALQSSFKGCEIDYVSVSERQPNNILSNVINNVESALNKLLKRKQDTYGKVAIDGIFHLAGVYKDQPLEKMDKAGWDKAIFAKVSLSNALVTYLENHSPEGIFVQFSSINSFFGGHSVGAYSFANAYQAVLHRERNQESSIKSWCVHWSAWRGAGMAKGFSPTDLRLAENKGFVPFDPVCDGQWFENVLRHEPGDYFVGLEPNNENIAPHIDWYCNSIHQAQVHIVKPEGLRDLNLIDSAVGAAIRGRFSAVGYKSLEIILHDHPFPLDEQGSINLKRALQAHHIIETETPPQNSIEQGIADIWSLVLAVDVNDMKRSFFEYGGHSIAATKIINQINQRFDKALAVSLLFQYPTIAELALHVTGQVSNCASLALQDAAKHLSEDILFEQVKAPVTTLGETAHSLVVLPTAIGISSAYVELVGRFSGNAPVYSLSLPNIGVESCDQTTLQSLGARVARALLNTELDLENVSLLGWSYGGVLGYEVCRYLQENQHATPQLIMLDSGFSKGLHAITFDENFQQVMFASELGLMPGAIPDFTAQKGIENRLQWLSQNLTDHGVELSHQVLTDWWLLFKSRLDSLLNYDPGEWVHRNNIFLLKAAQHQHGRDDLGWKGLSHHFKKHTINTDHQGIVKSQMTVEWLEHFIKQEA